MNLHAPLDAATVDRKKLLKDFKKFSKALKREVAENKVTREVELAATKVKLVGGDRDSRDRYPSLL